MCSFLLVPCKAEGKADQVILVTDENKQPLAGVKLEAYQDMEGKKPLMDENDQPLIITSNEEGRADPDAAPYLRIQSMPGFYHDPSVYPADHENLTLHHIHVEGKVRKNKEEDEDTKNTEDHTKEEEKNEPLKYEHREYDYKKSYGMRFKIYIWTNNSGSLEYDSDDALRTAAANGRLNDVSSLKIEMDLDFGRGKEGAIEEHKNEFVISFRPYDIKFVRNSNYNDPEMDDLEKQIVNLMEDFPATKTIFTPGQ